MIPPRAGADVKIGKIGNINTLYGLGKLGDMGCCPFFFFFLKLFPNS